MLRRLRIQNLAIVENVEIEFGSGLNILTGETGAGKSIVLDALLLLGGTRSSSSDVRTGEKLATLEADLRISDPTFKKLLEDRGIPLEDAEITLRRVIQSDGKSKVFLNDQSITVSTLQECAKFWLDITGQHSQQLLKDPVYQLQVIDQYGSLESLLVSYQGKYAQAMELQRQIQDIVQNKQQWQRDRDYIEYQLKDLEAANLQAGELERLEADSQRISHLEKLSHSVKTTQDLLDGDAGVFELMGKLGKELQTIEKIDSSSDVLRSQFQEIETSLQTMSNHIASYAGKLDVDPNEIELVNERISLLQKISRKFGGMEQAILLRDELKRKLQIVEDSSMEEAELNGKLQNLLGELRALDEDLSKRRSTAGNRLAKIVVEELKHLGMASSVLTIAVSPVSEGGLKSNDRWFGPTGSTRVQFLFSANPGVPPHPIDKIASGGEFSRVLLAIKALSMKSERFTDVKVYVFDEVDSGIGGPTAERVGLRLKALSQKGQVLCVTHLAQVACYADTHFNVEKTVAKGKTRMQVKELVSKDRRAELARMIGGLKISDKVLEHAQELLHRGTQKMSAVL